MEPITKIFVRFEFLTKMDVIFCCVKVDAKAPGDKFLMSLDTLKKARKQLETEDKLILGYL